MLVCAFHRAVEKVLHVKVFDLSGVDDRSAFKLAFCYEVVVNGKKKFHLVELKM